jgi:hypothetical protein
MIFCTDVSLVSKEEPPRTRGPNYSMRISLSAPNHGTLDISFEMLEQGCLLGISQCAYQVRSVWPSPLFELGAVYPTIVLSLHGGRSVLTFHFTSALSSKIITRHPQRAFPSWNCPVDYAGDGSVGFPNGGLPLPTSTTVLGRFPERGLPHPHVNWLAER